MTTAPPPSSADSASPAKPRLGFGWQLFLLTAALVVGFVMLRPVRPEWVHPWWGLLLGYMVFITAGAYGLTARLVARKPDSAVNAYLGSVTLRLLVSGIFIGVVLFRDPPQMWLLVLTFFALYFLYGGFEIRAVVRTLRPFSTGDDGDSEKS